MVFSKSNKYLEKHAKTIFIFLTVFSILISLLRLLIIDVNSAIYLNDGYLQYAEMLKKGLINGDFSHFERDEWFINYIHKNRVAYPFFVAVISILFFLPTFLTGIILSITSVLLSLRLFYKSYSENLTHFERFIVLIFLVSNSTIMTNFCRFATEGFQTLFIIISLVSFNKWKETKKKVFIFYYSLSLVIAILTRESSVLLLFVFVFDLIKKRKWRFILLGLTLATLISFSFIKMADSSLLFILLRNVFSEPVALDLSQGRKILVSFVTPLDNKLDFYNIYYIFQALIFSFAIYGFFGLYGMYIESVRDKKVKYKIESNWVKVYIFFLFFLYNGRILDRFFIPIIYFISLYAIEGTNKIYDYLKKVEKKAPDSIFGIWAHRIKNKESLWLYCILFNLFVSIVRVMIALLF